MRSGRSLIPWELHEYSATPIKPVQLAHTSCAIFECENFYRAIVSRFRKFCDQRCESVFAYRFPSILRVPDCVKSQDVPAAGSHPFGNFLVSRNLAAVTLNLSKEASPGTL